MPKYVRLPAMLIMVLAVLFVSQFGFTGHSYAQGPSSRLSGRNTSGSLASLSKKSVAAPSTGQFPDWKAPGKHAVKPRKVNTFEIPQVENNQFPPISIPSDPDTTARAQVPDPQNVVRVPAPAPVDPPLITNRRFEGLQESGYEPSDSNGAGGIGYYFETVNQTLAIYNLAGSQQYKTTFQAWFDRPAKASIFDPVVQWDKTGGRFLFIVTTGSSLLLSVAQQTSALGNYCDYTFATPSGYFADYEKMGVNADGVYFSVNLYIGMPRKFVSNELFFADRNRLESCMDASFTTWRDLRNPDGTLAFAIVPARQDSNSNGVEYLVNSDPGGACKLTLWNLTRNRVLSNRTVNTQCYSPPPAAPQQGSTVKIDVGDDRLYQANFLNGLLTLNTTGSFDFHDGNGRVGIVEWFVLNASAGTVFQQGSFGTPGFWLFYPATIRNSAGNMLFVYDVSGKSIHPSIWYANQDQSNTQILANGVSTYGTKGTARWGDYSSAWLNPAMASPNSIWITSQYAKRTDFWGTRVARVTP